MKTQRPLLIRGAVVLLVLAFIGYVGFLTLDVVRQSPAREVTTELPGYGLVSLRLTTDPNPALPTGRVSLEFEPRVPGRNEPVDLDSLSFSYGRDQSGEPQGRSEASPSTDGSSRYEASVVFGSAGRWWLRVVMERNGEQAEATYILVVEPAQ